VCLESRPSQTQSGGGGGFLIGEEEIDEKGVDAFVSARKDIRPSGWRDVIKWRGLGPFTRRPVRTEPLAVSPAPSGGDDERLHEAVVANFSTLWRFLRRMGVAEQDAEDVGQAVLVVFARKFGSISVGAERSFLLGTALRLAADYRKSERRKKELPLGEGALVEVRNPGPDAEDDAERRRQRRWLDHLLARLPTELREVFVLVELEDLTMAESAAALGVPAGTVASRLRRAREAFAAEVTAFRARLQEEMADE
jgi:RNA polymerase sigma-70 factor (ECF subfamily)